MKVNRRVSFHHRMIDEKIRSGYAKFHFIWIYDPVIEGVYDIIRVPRSRWYCFDKRRPHSFRLTV